MDSKYKDRVVGLLVNPKDGVLYYSERDGRSALTIRTLDDDVIGSAYFNDENMDSDYATSQDITGYPRAHTPGALEDVDNMGKGLGTVVYTAICQAAHLSWTGEVAFETQVDGDGISSSTDTRSVLADAWWERAKTRFGLAMEVEGCSTKPFSFEDDSIGGRAAKDIVEDRLKKERKMKGVQVDDATVVYSADGHHEVCGVADAYPYKNAKNANLVVGRFDEDSNPTFVDAEVNEWMDIQKKVFLACNLSVYDPTTTEGVAIFYKLVGIAQHLGATSRELESMRVRFYDSADIVLGADYEHPALVAQSYQHPVLSTGKVLPMNVRGKRQNMLVGPGRGRRLHPKKMRWWPTSASGAIMAVTPATKRPLEELAEARRALGWGAFADGED